MLEDVFQATLMFIAIVLTGLVLGRLVNAYAASRHGTRLGERYMDWRRRRYQARLARRMAAGEDRYFEELRSILAADPDRVIETSSRRRWFDMAFGLMSLALSCLMMAGAF